MQVGGANNVNVSQGNRFVYTPTRRRFLHAAASLPVAAGLLPMLMPSASQGAAPSMQGVDTPHEIKFTTPDGSDPGIKVLLINMQGGLSFFDTFDPKTNDSIKGPFKPIDTSAKGVQITNILAPLARHMDKFLIVNNLYGFGNNHPVNAAKLFTGDSSVITRGNFLTKVKQTNPFVEFSQMLTNETPGDIGYVVLHQNTKEPFGYKRLYALPYGGQKHDDPETVYSAYDAKTGKFSDPFGSNLRVSQDRFDARMKLLETMNQHGQHLTGKSVDRHRRSMDKAEGMLGGGFNKLFDVGDESPEMIARYGDTKVGKQFIIAKRLLENGARIVCANDGNYDNHGALYRNMRIMVPRFAKALSALLDDIEKMDEKVYVVMVTEFGRSPTFNHLAGREHWATAFGMLVAGGDIDGGRVIGKTNNGGEIVGDGFDSALVGETILDLMKVGRFEMRDGFATDVRFPFIDLDKEKIVG